MLTDLPLMTPVPWFPPERIFEPFAREPWAILLHSERLDAHFGRYSFIGLDPFEVITDSVFEKLSETLLKYRHPTHPALPPLQSGALGFLGYELLHELENLPHLPYHTLPFPDAVFGLYDALIVFDNHLQQAWLTSSGFPEHIAEKRYQRAQERLSWLQKHYQDASQHPLAPRVPQPAIAASALRSNFRRQTYISAVERTKVAILKGDFFEANISQQFSVPRPPDFDPWSLYLNSLKYNAAPFSAYFNTPYGTLISASPERFIQCQESQVTTCPIKGTRPRLPEPSADTQIAQALLHSSKDRSENIMIVDLMRNDLSRVCEPHSVQVPQLCALESFPTVHHLVSTVKGRLKPAYTLIDLLKACFPAGSVTGAPKVEVLKHIQQIERVRRGPYCGNIGYLSFHQTLDTSVTIRTYTITPETIYFQTGGAVTLDSEPAEEYQESLDKAAALIRALTQREPIA